MKVDMSATINGLEGKPLTESGKQFTLAIAVVTSLLAPDDQDKNMSAEEKVKRFKLAMQANEATELDLSAEDITMIKKAINRLYAPLVVGRAYELLDPIQDKIKVVK